MTHRGRALTALFVLLCIVVTARATPVALRLSDEERAWVKAHPVVEVGISPVFAPLEYMKNGELKGLTSQYLREIASKTGLEFHYVEVPSPVRRRQMLMEGKLGVLSLTRNLETDDNTGVAFTSAYETGASLLVTRNGHAVVVDGSQLEGQTIAIPNPYPYEAWLATHAPRAKVLRTTSALELLTAVESGKADVAVAMDVYLLPYLHRQFKGTLQISGAIGGLSTGFRMAVRSEDTTLLSILDKALASLTDEESSSIYNRWLGSEGALEPPTLEQLVHYHPDGIGMAVLALALLAALIFQMHRRRQQAELSQQEKSHFLATISHEIRSPMNAMLAAVELLQHTPLNPSQRHFVQLANNGGSTLLRLLDDVLDLSKLEAGQLKVEREPTELTALVRDVVALHRLRADGKNIALHATVPAAAEWLMLDPTRTAQVLHNLISNAIKFTDTGGVEVKLEVGDAYTHPHAEGDRRAVMTIIDTGIGISEETQARLFMPYAQAAKAYKRSGGTGLGLVICRELATLLNGTVTLTSAPGQGTRVVFSLSAQRCAPAAPADNEHPDSSPALTNGAVTQAHGAVTQAHAVLPNGALRVLIVEDTPVNQQALQAQIQGFGLEAVVAQDGAQALALFSQGAFSLVLMDCDLPDKDGYTLAAELRGIEARQQRARCPIVATSASTGEAHTVRCFDAGMDGVLSKPIRLAKLQGVIELWCGATFVPQASAASLPPEVLAPPAVRAAVDKDVSDLLQAVALRDTDAALRAAHRLHGAALTLGWTDTAHVAGELEALLRQPAPWSDNRHTAMLAKLLRCWRETSQTSENSENGKRRESA